MAPDLFGRWAPRYPVCHGPNFLQCPLFSSTTKQNHDGTRMLLRRNTHPMGWYQQEDVICEEQLQRSFQFHQFPEFCSAIRWPPCSLFHLLPHIRCRRTLSNQCGRIPFWCARCARFLWKKGRGFVQRYEGTGWTKISSDDGLDISSPKMSSSIPAASNNGRIFWENAVFVVFLPAWGWRKTLIFLGLPLKPGKLGKKHQWLKQLWKLLSFRSVKYLVLPQLTVDDLLYFVSPQDTSVLTGVIKIHSPFFEPATKTKIPSWTHPHNQNNS